MDEMKNFKRTFSSNANAFYWASQGFWNEALDKKIFEYNLHLDPPRAARLYAIAAIGYYDGFVACIFGNIMYGSSKKCHLLCATEVSCAATIVVSCDKLSVLIALITITSQDTYFPVFIIFVPLLRN